MPVTDNGKWTRYLRGTGRADQGSAGFRESSRRKAMENKLSPLESIPHVCERVCLLWGTPELDIYLNSIVLDSRGGTRKGLPSVVESELIWIQEINKLRRALEIQGQQKVNLQQALADVEAVDDSARPTDVWGTPLVGGKNPGRRYSDNAGSTRPHRRKEENTLFGIVFGAITNKYTLFALIALLSLKALWPTIKIFL